MFDSNNHVGRPSNEELKRKRNMKILLFSAPVLIVVFAIVLVTSGSLSNLMGNSVSNYYCDSGYTLSGSNCTKTTKEKSYLLGDVDMDGKIAVNDMTVMQKIMSEFESPDERQKVLADINGDGEINVLDMTLMQKYFSNEKVTTNGETNNIGKKRVCAAGFKLSGAICIKTETVPAKAKNNDVSSSQYTCQDQTYTLEGNMCKKTLTQTPLLIGDINKDGVINISDQTEFQKYFSELVKFDDTQMLLADLDNSGVVDVNDLTYLQLYLSEKLNQNAGTSGGTNGSGYEAYQIGKSKICPVGYNFNATKTLCTKVDTVAAVQK